MAKKKVVKEVCLHPAFRVILDIRCSTGYGCSCCGGTEHNPKVNIICGVCSWDLSIEVGLDDYSGEGFATLFEHVKKLEAEGKKLT